MGAKVNELSHLGGWLKKNGKAPTTKKIRNLCQDQ